MSQHHGLKVLAVTFDQFDQTKIGEHNLNILRDIGVDHITSPSTLNLSSYLYCVDLKKLEIHIG